MQGRYYQGSDYISDVRTLIHDPSLSDYTDAQILNFVNKARFRVAMDCRCVRQRVFGLNTITQQEQYPLTDFVGGLAVTAGGSGYVAPTLSITGGGGSGATGVTGITTGGALDPNQTMITNYGNTYTSQPAVTISDAKGTGGVISAINGTSILDLYSISVLLSGSANPTGATLALTFNWLPFSAFQAFCRAYRQQFGWPGAYTVHYGPTTPLAQTSNAQSVFMFPIPNQPMPMEWDAITLPNALPLTTTTDFQIIPPWTDAVQFYAAHYAYLGNQQYAFAQAQLGLYRERTAEIPATARGPRVHSFYRTYARLVRKM